MLLKRNVALLLALLLVGCACIAGAEALSPTTGLPTDKPYRPVLVEVSNSPEARPPWNLYKADIIYEMIYWGPQHTRYLALYNDEHPDKVGSIRGSRVYGMALQQAWDSLIVHWGGQDVPGTSIYDFKKEYGITSAFSNDGTRDGKRYSREAGRPSPHNAVVELKALVEKDWPVDEDGKPYEPRLPGMLFSDNPVKGERAAEKIQLIYGGDDYQPSYTYEAGLNGYVRVYNGTACHDEGSTEFYVAQNVIVQENSEYFAETAPSRPVIVTTGGGRMRAYIDGRVSEGYWLRPTMADPIEYYDSYGEKITFRPGKTFVQMTPPHMYDAMVVDSVSGDVYSNELWFYEPPVVEE